MSTNAATSPDLQNTQARFRELIAQVTGEIAGPPLDAALQRKLNTWAPPASAIFQDLFAACRDGIAQGWMCKYEGGCIRYGRVIKPDPALHGYSVDVVDMDRIAGPHHAHPNGEIDLVMPLEEGAKFDEQPAGWKVYEPGSAHYPIVTDGRAIVLYLLPQGAIEFTKSAGKNA